MYATIPIIREDNTIFKRVIVVSLIPTRPIFFFRFISNNPVQSIADMLVAKARPAIPKYLDSITFKIIFIHIDKTALIIGVLVSCNA